MEGVTEDDKAVAIANLQSDIDNLITDFEKKFPMMIDEIYVGRQFVKGGPSLFTGVSVEAYDQDN